MQIVGFPTRRLKYLHERIVLDARINQGSALLLIRHATNPAMKLGFCDLELTFTVMKLMGLTGP